MAFDLNSARTSVEFTINEQDRDALADPEQRAHLLNALLENRNLLRVKKFINFINNFAAEDRLKLAEHISVNVRTLLVPQADIKVMYSYIDNPKTIHHDNFRFDDPNFYKAKRITFLEFKLSDGVSDAEMKLEMLKAFLFYELVKCKHLQSCDFYGRINFPAPFLNQRTKYLIDKMIDENKVYRSKYKFNLSRYMGIGFGLVGLSTMLIPGWGIFSSILSAALNYVGGLNVGSAISFLREKFLFKVGLKHLQALNQKQAPATNAIKESLVAGLESKQWKGYFNSFLNLKTYSPTNYKAYAAGLYVGVNRVKDYKEAIKSLKLGV